MYTDITRAQVTRIGVDPPHESSSTRANFDRGTNTETVSVDSFNPGQKPMISVYRTGLVQQKPHRAIVVGHHNIDGAVIVDVTESCAAAYLGNAQRRTSNSGYLTKLSSVAFVAE